MISIDQRKNKRNSILLEAFNEDSEEYQFMLETRPDLDPGVVRHLMLMERLGWILNALCNIEGNQP
jgi:hypothetical protein